MKDAVVIVAAKRTAIGKFQGTLATTSAVELATTTIKHCLTELPTDLSIDEVILGQVLQAGLGQNPARQVSLAAGLAVETPALTINKVCGSGLKSVMLGAQAILVDDNKTCIVGGMENMSAAPYLLMKARTGYRLGNDALIDSMIHDGLWCATNHYHMGIIAENIAKMYGINRTEQDNMALLSQKKAHQAITEHRFEAEIVPVPIKQCQQTKVFDKDEYPRAEATFESLKKLTPVFLPDGTVTAGNASGLNDGAATLVLMKESIACSMGIKPLARVISWASAGVAPEMTGLAPVYAAHKALKIAGLTINNIDLIELNEAFAVQVIAVSRELGLDQNKVNINGGSIALGHPIGASGARILVTLTHALHAYDKTFGLATLCIGGGLGCSMIIERV